MSKMNRTRHGCKDVFRAFMVENAVYDDALEIPKIASTTELAPTRLIAFSKAIGGKDFDAWVHFYEDDASLERLWNQPNRYLPILKRYQGVITPDFSLYRDMPLVMQYWNIYRSHAIAVWLQSNEVPVIANVRWGDTRTFDVCCTGIPADSMIAVGSHGCVKVSSDRKIFMEGLEYVVNKLTPRAIIVYGTAQDSIFSKYRKAGIQILQFDSECARAHRKAVGY